MAKSGRIDKSRVSEDVIMKVFWRQNDRFADLFNAVLYDGLGYVKEYNGIKQWMMRWSFLVLSQQKGKS